MSVFVCGVLSSVCDALCSGGSFSNAVHIFAHVQSASSAARITANSATAPRCTHVKVCETRSWLVCLAKQATAIGHINTKAVPKALQPSSRPKYKSLNHNKSLRCSRPRWSNTSLSTRKKLKQPQQMPPPRWGSALCLLCHQLHFAQVRNSVSVA